MTIVSRALRPINRGRQKLVDVGLRPTRVWVRAGAWDGGETLLGSLDATDTEIIPRPKVTEVRDGVLTVTNITPAFAGGGRSPADLQPPIAEATDYTYIVQRPDGALDAHRVVSINQDSAFRYTVILERIGRARPDYDD